MILGNPLSTNDSRILIEDSVMANAGVYRQVKTNAPEAGGILLGFRRDIHLHVAMATPPGPRDRRTKYHFYRDAESHAQTALSEWAKTQETMDYVGEWHTHPEHHPQPSALDLQEWRQICRRGKEPMVFMILGTLSCWIGIGLGRDIKIAEPI
jgi:integrative and conjugative element protein (TIGR02256 family)